MPIRHITPVLLAAGALACALPASANEPVELRQDQPVRLYLGDDAGPRQEALVYPTEIFGASRAIIETVKDYYDADVVEDSGQAVPEDVVHSIRPGEALPESVEAQPIPQDLASQLPRAGSWVSVGETLVALDQGGTVTAVYYEMLPLNP